MDRKLGGRQTEGAGERALAAKRSGASDGREGKHPQTQVLTQGARERARRLSRPRIQERVDDRQCHRERGEAGLSRPEGERLPHLSSLCSSLLCSIPSRLPSARASRVKPSRQLQKLPRGNPIAADAEGMQQRARHVALLHAAVRHRQDYSRAGAGEPPQDPRRGLGNCGLGGAGEAGMAYARGGGVARACVGASEL